MMLRITNPFLKAYRYRMSILRVENIENYTATSTCRVQPGLTSYETWPYAILRVIITDVTFITNENEMGCKVW